VAGYVDPTPEGGRDELCHVSCPGLWD
jgi:hypothetical protein